MLLFTSRCFDTYSNASYHTDSYNSDLAYTLCIVGLPSTCIMLSIFDESIIQMNLAYVSSSCRCSLSYKILLYPDDDLAYVCMYVTSHLG